MDGPIWLSAESSKLICKLHIFKTEGSYLHCKMNIHESHVTTQRWTISAYVLNVTQRYLYPPAPLPTQMMLISYVPSYILHSNANLMVMSSFFFNTVLHSINIYISRVGFIDILLCDPSKKYWDKLGIIYYTHTHT